LATDQAPQTLWERALFSAIAYDGAFCRHLPRFDEVFFDSAGASFPLPATFATRLYLGEVVPGDHGRGQSKNPSPFSPWGLGWEREL